MRLLIHDASVLVDLAEYGLLEKALDLPYKMETTDFVQHEIQEPEQAKHLAECIGRGAISIIKSTFEQIAEIAFLFSQSPSLSMPDCSVLFHAQNRKGIVLTGDSRLRKEARTKGLEVHGTLWILDLLVAQQLIDAVEAKEKLEFLIKSNPRLPKTKCSKLIESWLTKDR